MPYHQNNIETNHGPNQTVCHSKKGTNKLVRSGLKMICHDFRGGQSSKKKQYVERKEGCRVEGGLVELE